MWPQFVVKGQSKEPLLKGKIISTVDLLVLTSVDQLLLTMQTIVAFLQNKLP
jgi:hypothetical protein